MFVLALALLAAPAALPAAEPQRSHAVRKARRAKPRARVRTVKLTPLPLPDHNAKYRVAETDAPIDFKTRVVERGTFKDCGVTGMPVCPSKGMPILQSEPR